MSLLKVSNLSKSFGGIQANSNVSFDVREGQIVGMIGPNGAGKTTAFNLISGFFLPSSGEIIFNGENITNTKPAKAARKGLVRTFQHTNVFTELTVFENILTGQYIVSSKYMKDAFLRQKKYLKDIEYLNDSTNEIINLMGLQEKRDVEAKNLSYGDQRKLAIGIALGANPKLLLLDEPAAGLNDTESANLVKIIKTLIDKEISVLIVEHDMKVVMKLCDYLVVLDQGKMIAEGTPKEVANNPKVIEVYLGTSDEEEVEEELNEKKETMKDA